MHGVPDGCLNALSGVHLVGLLESGPSTFARGVHLMVGPELPTIIVLEFLFLLVSGIIVPG